MGAIFPANLVTCPQCDTTFQNNKINGIALIEAVNHIEARKRMYCKLALDDFEKLAAKEGQITFPAAKKVLLDNFNDLTRDVQTILGLGNEVE